MCWTFSAYFAIVLISSLAVSVYYRATFLAEHTWLAETLRPVSRRSCKLPIHQPTEESASQAQSIHNSSIKPLRIGVLMLYETADTSKAWMKDMLSPLVEMRKRYCARHNYTLLNVNKLVDRSRPIAWSKLVALEHLFKTEDFDYLFYLDMDTVIMNPDVALESFIDVSARQFDVIITEDMNGLNTGAFIMRNTPWTLWFLRTAWEQTQLIDRKGTRGSSYSSSGNSNSSNSTSSTASPQYLFRWEQRAFHYMTNSVQWQQAKLPVYPGDYREIRRHFYTLPQCAFNSYILHPLDVHAVREESQYAPGDFLIHFAGKRGAYKRELMRYYLDQALRADSSYIRTTGSGTVMDHTPPRRALGALRGAAR